MNNKNIFANNLRRQMELNNKTRKEVCGDLGFSYFTFSDWVNGKKYPRMDKVEMLAKYFGIKKSELIEENSADIKKDNDIKSIVARMERDSDFFEIIKLIDSFDGEKLHKIKQMILLFD